MFALAPSAPKAETERCALGAKSALGHPLWEPPKQIAPTSKPTSKTDGHVRKGRSGSCRGGRNALMSILKLPLL